MAGQRRLGHPGAAGERLTDHKRLPPGQAEALPLKPKTVDHDGEPRGRERVEKKKVKAGVEPDRYNVIGSAA